MNIKPLIITSFCFFLTSYATSDENFNENFYDDMIPDQEEIDAEIGSDSAESEENFSAKQDSLPSKTAISSSGASPSAYNPGDLVPDEVLKNLNIDDFFTVSLIPDSIFTFMQGKSYKQNTSIPRGALRYIRCLHRDIEGKSYVGEMVLNMTIADTVLNIFRELYDTHYPIQKMLLVDNWDADDERSMTDNNSSSFNFRFITNTKRVSKHGLGLAIDINPLYNPCFSPSNPNGKVEPEAGRKYTDRTQPFNYKIQKGDRCYRLFTQAGFRWGGDWNKKKDYQHFEK